MGSKIRIATPIVAILNSYIKCYKIKQYIEPFVGGANIVDKIVAEKRYASDSHPYLIALYQHLDRLDKLPEEMTYEIYDKVRKDYREQNGVYEDWYIGAIGFLASYVGRFFEGGYSGLSDDSSCRDYYKESLRFIKNQVKDLTDVEFRCHDYRALGAEIESSLIYCDPPYKDTKEYENAKAFDYECFWEWVREMSKKNIVIVSETVAPDDFNCIWERKIQRNVGGNNKYRVEKLFIHRSLDE